MCYLGDNVSSWRYSLVILKRDLIFMGGRVEFVGVPMKKGNERRWQKRKRRELVQTFHGPRGGAEKRALASSQSLHPHFNIFLYLSLRPSATTRWHRDFLSTSRPNCKQTVNNVLESLCTALRVSNKIYAILFANFLITKLSRKSYQL